MKDMMPITRSDIKLPDYRITVASQTSVILRLRFYVKQVWVNMHTLLLPRLWLDKVTAACEYVCYLFVFKLTYDL